MNMFQKRDHPLYAYIETYSMQSNKLKIIV